jgi:hypothetical protein
MSYLSRLRKDAWVDTCNLVFGAPFKTFAIATLAIALAIYLPRILANESADKLKEALVSLGWATAANVLLFTCAFLVHFFYLTPRRLLAEADSKVITLEERMKPRIKVSGDRQTENCFTIGGEIFYFRARLDSLGIDPILNVEAHVMALRKEGVSIPVGEYPQLMMHPGTPTLPALKYKVPGFIDVIKTDPENGRPILALAWSYASIDRWIVASEDVYEIDITISSTTAPPKDFTFEFKWDGDPFRAAFEARDASSIRLTVAG